MAKPKKLNTNLSKLKKLNFERKFLLIVPSLIDPTSGFSLLGFDKKFDVCVHNNLSTSLLSKSNERLSNLGSGATISNAGSNVPDTEIYQGLCTLQNINRDSHSSSTTYDAATLKSDSNDSQNTMRTVASATSLPYVTTPDNNSSISKSNSTENNSQNHLQLPVLVMHFDNSYTFDYASTQKNQLYIEKRSMHSKNVQFQMIFSFWSSELMELFVRVLEERVRLKRIGR